MLCGLDPIVFLYHWSLEGQVGNGFVSCLACVRARSVHATIVDRGCSAMLCGLL